MSYAIEVNQLSKSFRVGAFAQPKQVLFDLNFKVREGTTTGFVGANGSGKTTSLKCLLEFIFPEKGEIQFFGSELTRKSKEKIGYLPERPYFHEFLTGMEFLKFHWRLLGQPDKFFQEKALSALKKVDLTHAKDRFLRSYSKGMLQRIGLAQSILSDPRLLILDEPMSGLDPDGRLMVKDILREQQKNGITLFFSSHLLQDMEELCEDLLIINKGHILYNASMSGFMSKFPTLEQAYRQFRSDSERGES